MRRGLLMVVGFIVCSVTMLAGCASGVTKESLETAPEVGEAPAGLSLELDDSSGSFADAFQVSIAWGSVEGATGYELQSDSEYTESGWHTVSASDDEFLFTSTSTTAMIIGYEEVSVYRVRAVFDATNVSVSPWSESAKIATPRGNLLYEVEGTASTASITMRTSTGTEQADIKVPLTSTSGSMGIWLQATNMTPYLSAQATSSGSVTCRITRKGVVISENTSSGFASIATCSP